MRRKDREISDRQQMEAILSHCRVCRVALATPDGQPYVVPLSFGYAGGNPPALYFHSATTGRKLDLIRQNPRCAFVVDRALELVTGPAACDWGARYESVMGAGTIEVVTDEAERRTGLDRIMAQHGHPGSPGYRADDLGKTVVLKLTIREMTAKRCV